MIVWTTSVFVTAYWAEMKVFRISAQVLCKARSKLEIEMKQPGRPYLGRRSILESTMTEWFPNWPYHSGSETQTLALPIAHDCSYISNRAYASCARSWKYLIQKSCVILSFIGKSLVTAVVAKWRKRKEKEKKKWRRWINLGQVVSRPWASKHATNTFSKHPCHSCSPAIGHGVQFE